MASTISGFTIYTPTHKHVLARIKGAVLLTYGNKPAVLPCRATVIRIIVAPSRHCWAVHPLLVVPPWFTRVELAPQEQPDPLILGR